MNQELLRKAAEINQQLEKFGLAPSLDYKLAPALGGTLVGKPPVHGMTTQSSFGNPAATGPAPA
ncbi:MAG: hypothetical protein ACREMA_02620 [Longimicrobiales bacterium]